MRSVSCDMVGDFYMVHMSSDFIVAAPCRMESDGIIAEFKYMLDVHT